MEKFINPSEKPLYTAVLVISVIFYLLMVASIIGLIYLLFIGLGVIVAHALFLGRIRGNGVKVTPNQFPELYQTIGELSKKIQLPIQPDVYIIQEGGVLNAFATKFFSRTFVVLYADILEAAYAEGEDAVRFVVAHELAHIKQNHVNNQWLIFPGLMVPFLGSAYKRACEYTCDRIAAYCSPQGCINGLLMLAVGTKLYKKVDVRDYLNQGNYESGFWIWLAEKLNSHPFLFKRVQAVYPAASQPVVNTQEVQVFS